MRNKVLVLLGLIALALSVVGCQKSERTPAPVEPAEVRRPLVVATTTMIADMARKIGGPDIEVVGLMKLGQDPHAYQPTPEDAVAIRNADLVLANGLRLERGLDDLIAAAGNKAVELGGHPVIITREGQGGAPDPHIWWNAMFFRTCATETTARLLKLRPDKANDIRGRAAWLLTELSELHQYTAIAIAQIPEKKRLLVTSHAAFNYFGEAYNIEVAPVLGTDPDTPPNTGESARLAALCAKRGVPAMFHENSVSPAQNELIDAVLRLAKKKKNFPIVVAGTLSSGSLGEPGTPAGSYLGAFKQNVRIIVEALAGKKAHPYFYQKDRRAR
ncbi:MAG: metal ABC transporter substrate-binding protein [Candidatus Lernaella stagnicola]|nr:metal ABC transporter substrate-binding protein [Candidatus Lernaella stagnicola]